VPVPGGDSSAFAAAATEPSTQLWFEVKEALATLGPEACATALRYVESPDWHTRLLGLALLANVPELDRVLLSKIIEQTDLKSQFTLWGWLREAGRVAEARHIEDVLEKRNYAAIEVMDAIREGGLEAKGLRVALDWLQKHAAERDYIQIVWRLASDEQAELSQRIDAEVRLALSQESCNVRQLDEPQFDKIQSSEARYVFSSVMDCIHTLQSNSAEVAPHEEEQAQTNASLRLCMADVYAIWHSDFDFRLQMLSSIIEQLLVSTSASVEFGTASSLRRLIKDSENRPWTDDQKVSLERLASQLQRLKSREQADRNNNF
jgi:hypothetical protein